jgi:ribosomal protein S6
MTFQFTSEYATCKTLEKQMEMRFEVARKLMVHAEDVNELEHPERPGYT